MKTMLCDNDPRTWILALIFAILVAALMMMGTGCITYNKCLEKFGETETDTITITETYMVPYQVDVPVPSDSAQASINIDSIAAFTEGLIHTIESERARLTWWRDRYNRLKLRADCEPDTIRATDTVEVPVEVPVEVNTNTFTEPPKPQRSFVERVALGIGTFFLLLVAIIGTYIGGKALLGIWFPGIKAFKIINKFL